MGEKGAYHTLERSDQLRCLSGVLTDSGIRFVENESLAMHTTFRIGGPASIAAFPADENQMVTVLRSCRSIGLPYAVLGCGSNVLAPDEGFDGCVIFTTDMQMLTITDTEMRAGAGVSLSYLACTARDAGLAGLAFAYGIPGSVGGAIYMNAGAYSGEIGDVLQNVTCYEPTEDRLVTMPRDACAFAYRASVFQNSGWILLSAVFSLTHGSKSEIQAQMRDHMACRREKQPLAYPSAGSAFKRGSGYIAAQLIDAAGLKGHTVGGAQVSEKHAGFIINRGEATAQDVQTLIRDVQQKVMETSGVFLEPEIKMLKTTM